MTDRFTGKPVDRPSDRLPHFNGGRCDTCGTETIDHCLRCGAPQCCPMCCKASLVNQEENAHATRHDDDQARRPDFIGHTDMPNSTDQAGCECMHWASARPDIQVLTGHHENCPKGGNLEESYKRLVAELVKGMENWAADEDGIHTDAWEAYKRGKCVIGQYDWKEEPASQHERSDMSESQSELAAPHGSTI